MYHINLLDFLSFSYWFFLFELIRKCREFSVCGGDGRSVWNDEILHKHTKAYIVSLLVVNKNTFYFKLIISISDWKKSCVTATWVVDFSCVIQTLPLWYSLEGNAELASRFPLGRGCRLWKVWFSLWKF